jgi:tetratricopeptide (TPR) repeat protein
MLSPMTKGSNQRRARRDSARCIEVAQRFLAAGQYADAIGPLLEATQHAPNDARLLNNLGLAYMFTRRFPEAITYLRRSIAARPDAVTYQNLGLALQSAGDDEGAIVAYRHAATLSPSLAVAHRRLADLLLDKGLRNEAAMAYQRAFDAAPGTSLGRLCRAKALAMDVQDRHLEAESELRQLIACDPADGVAHLTLGRVLQDAGRFDEAAACFERSIAIDPDAAPYQGLVSTRRVTEAERPWLSRILARLEAKDWERLFAPAMAERNRMSLHFAAAKALDDLGDYAEAIKHFVAANSIRRRVHPFNCKDVEQLADRLIARFTAEFLAQHSAIGGEDSTPVLIVGMPRSGTTLAERIVSSHPKVRGCGEVDFWILRGPDWIDAEPNQLAKAADRLRADYLRVLRGDACDAIRATDKMPFNFFWVGLVHLLFPNARIVHCRRNPVDTCWSIYRTPLSAAMNFSSALSDLASYYRIYLRVVEHWRGVIPSDRWLDLDYEEVVAHPEEQARRLIAFCDLEWDSACLRPEENDGAVKTASHWQVRQPIYRSSVERWRHYEPWIAELRDLLQPREKTELAQERAGATAAASH